MGIISFLIESLLFTVWDTVWTKTFGGANSDVAKDIAVDMAGNYIIVGATSSFGAGGSDALIIKLTPSGNATW